MSEKVAIILAAGMSKRMNTAKPKVLHEVCGRPMLAWVLDACSEAGVGTKYVVVGYGGEQVKEYFAGRDDLVWVTQEQQLGTGHAVLCCKEYLKDFGGKTMVICGDMPLVQTETLKTLIEKHESENSKCTLATAVLDDASGYGRIVRDQYGNLQGIVEHADCSPEQLKIKEVNPSYYLFDNKVLFEALAQVKPNNAKNEYYITDALQIIIAAGYKATAVTAVRPEAALGVNSRVHLAEVGKIMQSRIQKKLMDEGVTIVDPDGTWIDARALIGQDTVIEPFTYIRGAVSIGKGCRIGPFAYLVDGVAVEDGSSAGPGTGIGSTSGCGPKKGKCTC